jgi:hypothetical protein
MKCLAIALRMLWLSLRRPKAPAAPERIHLAPLWPGRRPRGS